MVKTLAQAEKFFETLPRSKRIDYDERSMRMRHLLSLVDNPQDSFKSIHIAGTSGKGTTATAISVLLQAAGKNTGLTLSPHARDIRERIQLNNRYIPIDELCAHINTIAPHINGMDAEEYGTPSYFEVMTAIAFMSFRHNQVDYAVVEVGMGGRMDATNVISRPDKLAVITQIGLDHTKFLGDTLPQIAGEKAGIIKPGIKVIALAQTPEVMDVFMSKARQTKANLEIFTPGKHVQHVTLSPTGSKFNLKLKPWMWRDLNVGPVGRHQAVNVGLALRAVQVLAERDGFSLNEPTARAALANLALPGRFDIVQAGGKYLVLDGAHNEQKLLGLVESLKAVFPGQKPAFLLSFKSDKDLKLALKVIAPVAGRVIVTALEGAGQDAPPDYVDPGFISAQLQQLGVHITTVVTSNRDALQAALDSPEQVIVCTGSFYLLDELYNELEKRGIE